MPLCFLSAGLCLFSYLLYLWQDSTEHMKDICNCRSAIVWSETGGQPRCGRNQQFPLATKTKKKSEISSLSNLNQNLHAGERISHLVKCSLLRKHTHLASTFSSCLLPPASISSSPCSSLNPPPQKAWYMLSWFWISPPGVPWPHPWALWECLPAGRSPSSCGCGCVLSGWGSQRCPGPELCWGTSFTGWRGASGQQAEGVGEPSRGPCLWLQGASVLLIRTGAPATQGDLNILKAPGQPKHLASPAHLAQGHTLTSMSSGGRFQKWRENEHGESQMQ